MLTMMIATSSSLINLQRGHTGDGIEVGILMEQLDVLCNAKGSDQTVDGLPDREASPSTGAVDLGRVFKYCQPIYPQYGIQ